MVDHSVPSALAGFKRLGRAALIHEPINTQSLVSKSSPDLIFICAWLDAQAQHISKYTSHYQTIYPYARILLVRTALPDLSWRPYSFVYESRRPAIELLLALPKGTKILLHAFSNGGAIAATGIAREYALRARHPLVITAKVLDSTPGRNNWSRAISAFSMGLPRHPVLRFLSGLFIKAFMALYVAFHWVLRRKDRIMSMRVDFNDKTIFDIKAKRLYIFSESDKMIHDGDVKDHVCEAKEMGWDVTVEEFVGTPHCGHVMGDSKRYWGAVERLWESANTL